MDSEPIPCPCDGCDQFGEETGCPDYSRISRCDRWAAWRREVEIIALKEAFPDIKEEDIRCGGTRN